jgi:hypothetical protein
MTTTRVLPLAALALATTLASCGGQPLSRSGTTTEPVTLTAAWGQGPTGVGGDVLRQLIDGTVDAPVRVEEGGRPRVGDTAEERHGVEDVMAGKADFTVVGGGLLQLVGAESLAPVGVRFVFTNNDQAAAVAADDELSERLMSDLEALGLMGLGLVPGGLRHPFAFGTEPLLGAGDYEDTVINVREDAGVLAILERLGAREDHSVDSERHLAAGKRLRGIEASVQQIGAVVLPALQTSNISLYEKFDVAVVRLDLWDGLNAAQRRDLRSSFRDAAEAAMDARVSEAEGQSAWCQTPYASSVLASKDEVATLHRALDPIEAELAEEDVDAARSLDRMRELGDGTTDPVATPCDMRAPEESAEAYYVEPRGDQRVLDGTWRLEIDLDALIDAGVGPSDAYANAGVWEFTITNGYADGVQPDGRRCNGNLAVDGAQVSLDLGVRGVEDCNGLMRGTYELRGDRLFFDWQKELEYDVFLDRAMFAPGLVRIE